MKNPVLSSFLSEKIQYIHQNPVKNVFVNKFQNWKYNSAVNIDFEDKEIHKLDSLYGL